MYLKKNTFLKKRFVSHTLNWYNNVNLNDYKKIMCSHNSNETWISYLNPSDRKLSGNKKIFLIVDVFFIIFRWLDYKKCGKQIEGTRIICFKTPLRDVSDFYLICLTFSHSVTFNTLPLKLTGTIIHCSVV